MAGFDPVFELSSLDGTNGFQISGEGPYDQSGRSVASAGDVNGDGFDEVIVGAPDSDNRSGASYVVFGEVGGFAAEIDLSNLDGTNGFKISGEAGYDRSGRSVASAGDVNGDGFDDMIVGAPYGVASPYGGYFGASYVVFGQAGGFAAEIDLSDLDGTNGFQISSEAAYDRSGRSVASAGDVNGDGFDDVIVGAFAAGAGAGASYVVFGQAGDFAAEIDLSDLNGTNGFQISGETASFLGLSVASAGDVNGDGFDDVIVGAYRADPNGTYSGASYVVFGQAGGFAAEIDVSDLNGTNGFQISGEVEFDRSGFSVASAGDVNGDGFDDLIVGAHTADPNGRSSGASYVVFGQAGGFAAEIDLSDLDGTNGFQISGEAADNRSGYSVASAGDLNGDGFDDLIVGASSGSYVVFGQAGFATEIDLSDLDGTNGFQISGASGVSVASAGDVNGDGLDDLIVGNGFGTSYVVFGQATTTPVGDAPVNTVPGPQTATEDTALPIAGVSVDDIDGGPLTTTLSAASGTLSVISGGAALVSNNGTATVTIAGTAADINAALAGLSYSGDPDFNGADTLTVETSDGTSTDTDTVAITVDPVDDAPVNTVPGPQSVDEDTALPIAGVSVDDIDSGTLDTTLTVLNGTLDIASGSGATVTGDGTDTVTIAGTAAEINAALAGLSYSGDPDFNGADTFTVETSDGTSTDTDTVAITVDPVDDAPVPQDDAFSTPENAPLGGSPNVFADNGSGSDSDPEGNPFLVTAVLGSAAAVGTQITLPSGALVTLDADGTLSYDPNAAFDFLPAPGSGASNTTATDSFTYTLTGGIGATVTLEVTGVDSDDRAEGTSGADTIDAGIGNDTVTAFEGDDTLMGDAGDDTLDGGTGADAMAGGAGDDTYVVDDAGDVVTENGGEGADTVESSITFKLGGGFNNLTLTGTANINGTGTGSDNALIGNSGNNKLDGGGGADSMAGGAGDDTYVVDDAGDVVTENGGEGADTVESSITFKLGGGFNNLTLTGSSNINGTGTGSDNTLIGNSGNNKLDGGGGADSMAGGAGDDTYVVDDAGDVVTENGGEGADTVESSITFKLGGGFNNLTLTGTANINGTGTGSDNALIGNSGNNKLDGGGGADSMAGGAGDDTYVVDDAGDVVTENGGEGADTVESSITFKLGGGFNNLTLTGSSNINGTGTGSDNALIGNSGNNKLDGGGGADSMAGGAGDDTYVVDNTGDVVSETGGGGRDTVEASITFTLAGGFNNLTLTGSSNINGTGTGSDNVLKGSTGRNTLSGGDGEDVLHGRDGNDRLIGGADADVFVFGDNDGADLVADFQNGLDTIDLTAVDDVSRFRDLDITDTGGGVLIDYGNGTIELDDVASAASIGRGDFIFA